jgi:serine/threonine-protein kinase HipA
MGRRAEIFFKGIPAGILTEDENGYTFEYYESYVLNKNESVSLTLPVSEKKYISPVLFPFFDGLIPEGWLLNIVENTWKINPRDRMSLLLACCRDCIGAVSVIPFEEEVMSGE